MSRKHRVAMVGVALALASMLFAVTATGAVDARLQGKFKVTAEITGGDGPPPVGTIVHRTYKFKPQCGAGVCDEVEIARQTSSGSFVKTILTHNGVGVYDGTEVQDNPVCANGDPATSRTGDIHVEITKAKNGKAIKVSGTLHFDTVGCSDTYQDAEFKGKLK